MKMVQKESWASILLILINFWIIDTRLTEDTPISSQNIPSLYSIYSSGFVDRDLYRLSFSLNE